MKFSIITVCYNEEKRIMKTMESIYGQTYTDYEHIIQDGMSSDGTLELIRKCNELYPTNNLKIYSEKDSGLYDAMNEAVSKAKGDYICFINSGDFLYDKDTLEKIAAEMEQNPAMDWYYGMAVVVYPNQDEYIQVLGNINDRDDLRDILENKSLSLIHQAIFASKKCFENNLFDISYKLRAELKWYYECLLRNIKVKRMQFPVCRYELGGLSEKISSAELNAIETERLLKDLDLYTENNKKWLPARDEPNVRIKNIYNQWLALLQSGRSLGKYFRDKGIGSIVIYGYSEFATHIINELKESDTKIMKIIDREYRCSYSNIPVCLPEEVENEGDLIIVTALLHYEEIKEYLKSKVNIQIVSLEDILIDMWNDEGR